MKAMQSEIKKNIQRTNSEGKETETHQRFGTEGRNKHLTKTESTRIQKNEEKLRNLWDNFKHSNLWTTGMPEGEEEEQEIGNLVERK